MSIKKGRTPKHAAPGKIERLTKDLLPAVVANLLADVVIQIVKWIWKLLRW